MAGILGPGHADVMVDSDQLSRLVGEVGVEFGRGRFGDLVRCRRLRGDGDRRVYLFRCDGV